jgi:hypothetical protein
MNIASKVDLLADLREQIKSLTTEADALTTELKAFAMREDTTIIAGYDNHATLSFRNTGERLDRKILANHITDQELRDMGALRPGTTTPVLTTTPSRPSSCGADHHAS